MDSEARPLGPKASVRWKCLRKRQENEDFEAEPGEGEICTSTRTRAIFLLRNQQSGDILDLLQATHRSQGIRGRECSHAQNMRVCARARARVCTCERET